MKVAFPRYRLPRLSDNLEEDRAYYRRQGHSGCLGVTSGDFNGDGSEDSAVLLRAIDGRSAVLVAALRVGPEWQAQTLRRFEKRELLNLYVTTVAPGEYKRAEYLDGPLEAGEVAAFRSERHGIATGTTEASSVLYFWTPERWIHVWASD
jgi:hypothetical protein